MAGKYPVKLLQEDITYANPSSSVQKYNKIKDQVVLFTQILGTTAYRLLPRLKRGSIGATTSIAYAGLIASKTFVISSAVSCPSLTASTLERWRWGGKKIALRGRDRYAKRASRVSAAFGTGISACSQAFQTGGPAL